MRVKSVIARVSREGDTYKALGFVLNDGSPLESVEVRVDDGPWQKASMEPSAGKYRLKTGNVRMKGQPVDSYWPCGHRQGRS